MKLSPPVYPHDAPNGRPFTSIRWRPKFMASPTECCGDSIEHVRSSYCFTLTVPFTHQSFLISLYPTSVNSTSVKSALHSNILHTSSQERTSWLSTRNCSREINPTPLLLPFLHACHAALLYSMGECRFSVIIRHDTASVSTRCQCLGETRSSLLLLRCV